MAKKRYWLARVLYWIKIRWELHRVLMNDRIAQDLIKKRDQAIVDREVLKWIASRQCTAVRDQHCIELRPDNPKDWCCRCLALDHLIRTE